jgi:hypothetical protein
MSPPSSIVPSLLPFNKLAILGEYEQQYGSLYTQSIITKTQSVQSSHLSNFPDSKRMWPSLDKYYRVEAVTFYNIITTVLCKCSASLSTQDLLHLQLSNKNFNEMIPKVIHWLTIDFSSLRALQYNYKSQSFIDPHRVEMANAAMVYFGWMGGKYMGQGQDIKLVLQFVAPYIHLESMHRILLDGCPAELLFTKPLSNKITMIHCENSRRLL